MGSNTLARVLGVDLVRRNSLQEEHSCNNYSCGKEVAYVPRCLVIHFVVMKDQADCNADEDTNDKKRSTSSKYQKADKHYKR